MDIMEMLRWQGLRMSLLHVLLSGGHIMEMLRGQGLLIMINKWVSYQSIIYTDIRNNNKY